MDQQRRRLWGRSLSRPLSPTLEALYEKRMGTLSYDTKDQTFWKTFSSYTLEIGFGDGEHFLQMVRAHPDQGFIGCERFINGVAKVIKSLDENPASNVRLYVDDIHLLLKNIPRSILSKIYVLFPDPWPKKRHNKRRLLNRDFITQCHHHITPGGLLCMASDIEDYREFIQEEIETIPHLFEVDAITEAPLTKYGRKAVREGRTSKMFIYKKI
ncbi:MAG: tRNA (guanosine(46)-N7)-methyltransferase TrmB [Alphaproteobacteria bacterium]|nr:tRNA (guanosine(46)-N7)-methyltransferase TrmB [Alphaproteobacteria bacterium]